MAWMAPRVGPMHGDQPMAKAAPSNGAPARPARGRQLTGAAYDRAEPEEHQAHDEHDGTADAHERALVLAEGEADGRHGAPPR